MMIKLVKECPECEQIFSVTKKACPNCGKIVSFTHTAKSFVEKSPIHLAMFCIALLLIVGFGWFLRMETGSRVVLFTVFFMVAPFVPWILKEAYRHATAHIDEEEDSKE